jgi:cobaltochelatase CobT
VDAEQLGGAMTDKLAELFDENDGEAKREKGMNTGALKAGSKPTPSGGGGGGASHRRAGVRTSAVPVRGASTS